MADCHCTGNHSSKEFVHSSMLPLMFCFVSEFYSNRMIGHHVLVAILWMPAMLKKKLAFLVPTWCGHTLIYPLYRCNIVIDPAWSCNVHRVLLCNVRQYLKSCASVRRAISRCIRHLADPEGSTSGRHFTRREHTATCD